MQVVADRDGRRWLLVKRSHESSLVRDPRTGKERYLPTGDLDPVAGASVLETAATKLPSPDEGPLASIPTPRGLGLLVLLADRGPTAVRDLLAHTDLCESDLHGLVGDLRAAGLLAPCEVGGEPGYGLTERAETAVESLRTDVEA